MPTVMVMTDDGAAKAPPPGRKDGPLCAEVVVQHSCFVCAQSAGRGATVGLLGFLSFSFSPKDTVTRACFLIYG